MDGKARLIAGGALAACLLGIAAPAVAPRSALTAGINDACLILLACVGLRLVRHATQNQRLIGALEDSSHRMTMVLDNTSDAVAFAAPDGKILEWNRGAEELFGLTREQAVGSNSFDHLLRPENAERIGKLLEEAGPRVSEVTVPLHIRGRVIPVTLQIAPVLGSRGELVGYVSVARDDTHRMVARHARQTFLDLDPDHAVERFAEALSTFVAFDVLSLSSVDDGEFRELARVTRGGEEWDNAFVAVSRDQLLEGPLREFGFTQTDDPYVIVSAEELADYADRVDMTTARSVIALPLRDDRADVRGFLVLAFSDQQAATGEVAEALARVTSDIGQSVQNMVLFEQQRRAAERLRELNELRDGFLALVAHEVRGPLSAIGSAANVLRLRGNSMPAQQVDEMLNGIASSAEHLTRVTGDLVDASRGGEGRFPCTIRNIDDLGELVRDAALGAAGDRSARVRVDVPACLAVRGDAGRLGQVVTNLVSNALKYADGEVDVSLRHVGNEAVISVADHGDGIPAAQHHLLFQRYTRLPHGEHATKGGSGLGLYIARELVAAHNGTITHQPTEGGGATFVVVLPGARVRLEQEQDA